MDRGLAEEDAETLDRHWRRRWIRGPLTMLGECVARRSGARPRPLVALPTSLAFVACVLLLGGTLGEWTVSFSRLRAYATRSRVGVFESETCRACADVIGARVCWCTGDREVEGKRFLTAGPHRASPSLEKPRPGT